MMEGATPRRWGPRRTALYLDDRSRLPGSRERLEISCSGNPASGERKAVEKCVCFIHWLPGGGYEGPGPGSASGFAPQCLLWDIFIDSCADSSMDVLQLLKFAIQ